MAEWATWIGLIVWGYGVGGVRGSAEIALVQLVPGALLATPAAALLGRLPHGRALALGYAAQTVGFLALGVALATTRRSPSWASRRPPRPSPSP